MIGASGPGGFRPASRPRAGPLPQRNRSSASGRWSGRRPGPVLGGDEALEARGQPRPASPASLSRARSAAAATSSAIAIAVAASSRPSRSRRPAPVVERLEAGAADRDVGLAEAPGSAEAVGDHDRGRAAAARPDLAADPPGRASGSSGSSATRSVARDVRGVDAGVGADEPRPVSTISTPGSARIDLPRLAEDQLDHARVLARAARRAPSARSAARRRRGRRPVPPPSRRPSGRSTTTSPSARPSARASAISAPRSVALARPRRDPVDRW